MLSKTFLIFIFLFNLANLNADWLQFRGPNGQGNSQAKGIPTELNKANTLWKIQPKGQGHGSPVIFKNKVFLITANEEKATLFLECFNLKDGSTQWVKSFQSQNYRKHRHNHLATTTPSIGDNLIFTLWGTPEAVIASAFDFDGNLKWKKNLGPHSSKHGFSISPFYYDGLVYINHHHLGDSAILALDAQNGKLRWQLKTESGRTAYGTPCIYKNQLVISGTGIGLIGVHPKKGKQLWQLNGLYKKRNLTGPVIAGDYLLSTNGSGGGGNYLVAVEPQLKDKIGKMIYTLKTNISYVPKPLVVGDQLFIVADTGRISCFNSQTGERYWKERIQGKAYSSPILVGKHIYAITQEGEISVFKASKQFELVSQSTLNDLCYSTPSVVDDHLLIHTYQSLFCFSKKQK